MTQAHVELVSTSKPLKCKPAANTSRKPKTTKRDQLLALLSRSTGATVSQLEKHLAWQSHTIRATISRLRSDGHSIVLDRSGKDTRYRLADAGKQ
jgi:predicted ArsR family transcriptional regulator